MKQFKSLGLTLVTAGIFFGLLVGVQFFFKNYYVADHFEEKLTKIHGIQKVEIDDSKIYITLSNVKNIKISYQEITNVINNKKYQIIIKDGTDEKLEEIALESEIAVQEGIFRGNFIEMSDFIKSLSRKNGVEARVFIDSERVYLQLVKEKQSIYRIIERPENNFSDQTV